MNPTAHRLPLFIAYLAIAVAVAIADQLSKQLILINLSGRAPVEVLPFFHLVLAFNKGAAFGFLSHASGWQHYALSAFAIVISSVLIAWLWQSHRNKVMLSLAIVLILGGAIGNLIDRIIHQQVIDFILLHYQNWHFPAFNLADCAISIGAVGVLLDNFSSPKLARKNP